MWNQDFEPRDFRGKRDDQRPRRGPRGEGHARGGQAFGGDPFFGPRGPFGPAGPFGPHSPFGPGGPFASRGFGGRGRGRARRGDIRQAVLALLAEEPMNGYQMIQTMAERTGGGWKPSPGAIYPALSQLEDERLIEPFDNNGAKAYRLTEGGQTAAALIDPKPWDAFNAENAPEHPEVLRGLWKEFSSLAMAAQELTRSGSRAQQQQAAQILAETRRSLYGLLASDGDGDGTEDDQDLANPDDLR
ncbi:MAG: PadR family transcriptional regulator [Micropruina sp.]|uniref:PadR family transcriptional regulator n=1 Tax=Micropruina sp. TaxID=2737536 RepID=UPI0039E6450D